VWFYYPTQGGFLSLSVFTGAVQTPRFTWGFDFTRVSYTLVLFGRIIPHKAREAVPVM
jgi:hypothetical protein